MDGLEQASECRGGFRRFTCYLYYLPADGCEVLHGIEQLLVVVIGAGGYPRPGLVQLLQGLLTAAIQEASKQASKQINSQPTSAVDPARGDQNSAFCSVTKGGAYLTFPGVYGARGWLARYLRLNRGYGEPEELHRSSPINPRNRDFLFRAAADRLKEARNRKSQFLGLIGLARCSSSGSPYPRLSRRHETTNPELLRPQGR